MKLVFSGLGFPIEITSGQVSVLEVFNQTLFARLCQSVMSMKEEGAVEPYSSWNEKGVKVGSKSSYIVVANPFLLPWNDRELSGELYKRFEEMILVDYVVREEMEQLAARLSSKISELSFSMNSYYSFGVEWEMRRYLKALEFGVDLLESDSLLDSLIKLFSLAADVSYSKAFIFVNLKTFLTERDIRILYEQVKFLNISVLLLENYSSDTMYANETKRVIDQDFIES